MDFSLFVIPFDVDPAVFGAFPVDLYFVVLAQDLE